MKMFGRYFSILTIVLVVFAACEIVAAASGGFSAEMISQSNGQRVEGKIFSSEGKTRTEMAGAIVIARLDKGISWVIMPSQNMYMEQAIDPTINAKVSKELPGEIEHVSLGMELVEGKPAQKFKVTYNQNGKQESIYQWIGQSEFPVKVQAVDGSWTVEYRNIQIGSQPDSLFEVPAGCQKFAMPAMPSGVTMPVGVGQGDES